MKRCPQCEFIYEDDQSLCDMDGVLLVFDSRTLPNAHALATVSAPLPDKARRSRMVPAFATLILMLLIASVYYVTALRNSRVADNFSPAVMTSAPVEPHAEPPVTDAAAAVPEPTPESNEIEAPPPESPAEEKRETHPTPAPKPAAAPAKKAVTQPATARSPEPRKDESKVGSILKKTGKILKKPFKF